MRKLLLWLCIPFSVFADERPNVLWITAEDMSATLGCYGDEFAITPNIDRLAGEGVRYTNAFATAPVCSPARSTLITGVYATSLGTQRLRSMFPIPDYVRGFPSFLKEQGYYTTNNVKTDYNTAQHGRLIDESWNEVSDTAHWRGKGGDQPFFHIFNDMTSHQSRTMVWPYEQFEFEVASQLSPEQIHDPGDAPIPPYYPDTPTIRRTVARFYDCVTAMDQNVGDLLDQLEEDGLAENTIVFFFSDHGSGMPRHKRNLQDTGMHVPLIIRFPEKWKHLAPASPGEAIDQLVSFVDFAPTMLSLLGLEIPAHMQGTAFLGEAAGEPRRYVFGARDRVDEAFDLSRSVRDKKWLYIRNFMPHLSYNQPCAWPGQGEIRKEIARLANAGSLRPGPARNYAGPTKPVEELYDTSVDPLCLNNLSLDPQHSAELERLRSEQLYWSLESGDVGFLPESIAWELAKERPLLELGDPDLLSQVREAAEIVGAGIERKEDALDALQSELAASRYWGVVALRALGQHALDASGALGAALSDSSPAVRIEAAGALVELGNARAGLTILGEEVLSEDLISALHACRTIELLGDKAASLKPQIQIVSEKCKEGMGQATDPLIPGKTDEFMFLGFSADAFLAALE
tara:strand:+ start:13260 stop:15152 length:1893 start_codon:yes stop_codon:yes gene_type:complete